ncbi:MAG: RagB/SusD family nutrient uptake outer membrane protein [Bacteroidetes bacterium]|nr:RagB/SusD family nutrient uptake outer membrane protein [Bacteroidota bacterium]
MKKIICLLLIVLPATLFNSCSEFLEENPVDRYVVSNVYTDESGAIASVTSIYNQLYNLYERYMYMVFDLPVDDEKNGQGMPNQYLQNLEYMRHTQNNTFVRNYWRFCYSGIFRANNALEQIPEIEMDETLKARLINEAKFLRALYFFNLVRAFGDVPLPIGTSVEETVTTRIPLSEVYAQIISDLNDAKALPKSYSGSNVGRATSGAASVLLGYVYVTMKDWSAAVTELGAVVNNESSFGYGLWDDLKDNYRIATENGKECVFNIQFAETPSNGNGDMALSGPKYTLQADYGIIAIPGVNGCNEADIPCEELYSQYDVEDQRKYIIFSKEFVSPLNGQTYYTQIPVYHSHWEDGETVAGNSDANTFVLRYSDALLLYAEALNENGDPAAAYTHLQRVRSRAYKNDPKGILQGAKTKENVGAWVRQERWQELAHEGKRWFDLVRWGILKERMTEHAQNEVALGGYESHKKLEIIANFKDAMSLMPIPQAELDANQLLVQNPGW